MFVVEIIISSQSAWVNVFSSSNLSLKHAYMNFPKLTTVCCVSRYVRIRAITHSITVYWNCCKMLTSKVLLKGSKVMEITGLGPWLPTGPVTGHRPTAGSSRPTLQIFATPTSQTVTWLHTWHEVLLSWDTNLSALMGWNLQCPWYLRWFEVYHLLPMCKVKTADVWDNTEQKRILLWLTMIFLVHLGPWHVSSSYRVPSRPLAVCTLPFQYRNASYPSRPSRESASSLCPTWSVKIFNPLNTELNPICQ